MTRLLLAVLFASGAAAQELPADVLFDDFEYASTEWRATLTGDPDAPDLGPEGSVFGPNEWVTSTSGETEMRRLWYRNGWQGAGYTPEARTLTPTPDGLRFAVAPGVHQGDGCRDENGSRYSVSAREIASGFTARRGTWISRLRLGSLPDPDDASMIHAFWLLGHAHGWVENDEGEPMRLTNEIDHEWNNRFLGGSQPFFFSSTGAATGTRAGWKKAPMSSPLLPAVTPGRSFRLSTPNAWTCRYTRGETDLSLTPEACAALLEGRTVDTLPRPTGEVWTTLLLHVGDEGIRYRLVSDGWGARVEMRSALLEPTTQLPLYALISQHLYPGGDGFTCDDRARLSRERVLEADWFLYHPDPSLSRTDALALVDTIRASGIPRLATIPGARLERPARPVVGYAGAWGQEEWTTQLSIRLEAPRRLAAGETATLLALPPERYGAYRYTWTLSTRYVDGRYITETADDAFALPFTMPEGAKTVLVRVRLEEITDRGDLVVNETVRPAERLFMIRRGRQIAER